MAKPKFRDEPRHGTHLGYMQDDCRCVPCTDAYRLYRKHLELGRKRMVPSAEGREIIERLKRNRGMSIPQIASALAGSASDRALYDVYNQRQPRMSIRILEALRDLEGKRVPLDRSKSMDLGPLRVLSLGIRLNGYSLEVISGEAGFEPKYLRRALSNYNNMTFSNYERFLRTMVAMRKWPMRDDKFGRKVRKAAFAEAELSDVG